MRITPYLALTILNFTLTACQDIPANRYTNIGDPERQLIMTTENDTVELLGQQSLDQLKETLKAETPNSAQLSCPTMNKICISAKSMLLKAKIPLEINGAANKDEESTGNTVTLTYQRINAQACENRYIDNSQNSANLTMPQLGCSVRSNMLEMVTNKKQFSNPSLLDYQDGEKAALTYQSYINPAATAAPAGGTADTGSLIGATQ